MQSHFMTNPTKSKPHWVVFLLTLLLALCGCGPMFLTLYISISDPGGQQFPAGSWFFVGSIASVGIFMVLCWLSLFKTITISENFITVRPLLGKEFKYKNEEILCWYEHVSAVRASHRETKIFNLKTTDGKIILFADYHFRNYKAIILPIITKTKMDYISNWYFYKRCAIFYLLSALLTAMILGATLKIGALMAV